MTAKKARGTHRGKYVRLHAAAPFCGVDMPSRPLNWNITPRHDKLMS